MCKDILKTEQKRVILHCDMNNFYASVECMLEPNLRDKCVAVAGNANDRHGIILAKNMKAKAFGVSTGETIWQATQKCKDLVVVPPHYEQYLKFSSLAREIYLRFTDMVEPYGMDECWLDVTGSSIYGNGEEIAEKIRQTIKYELGLTVSIGVSFNKIFAKLGSDLKKPDAITVLKKNSFKEKIWHLPAGELLGVGKATKRLLDKHFILTIGELANTDDNFLKHHFGINGLRLKAFANGLDTSLVTNHETQNPMKSIGHGITTIRDLENPAEVWCVILSLVQDIGSKLIKYHKKATGISITIKDNQLFSKQWQTKLPFPTQSASELAKNAFELFQNSYVWTNDVRSVTVTAISLTGENDNLQLDLYSDINSIKKRENLDLAVDNIRTRFGKNAIKNAVLCKDIKLAKNIDTGVIMPTGMVN